MLCRLIASLSVCVHIWKLHREIEMSIIIYFYWKDKTIRFLFISPFRYHNLKYLIDLSIVGRNEAEGIFKAGF